MDGVRAEEIGSEPSETSGFEVSARERAGITTDTARERDWPAGSFEN